MLKNSNRKVLLIAIVMITVGIIFSLGKSYAYFKTSITGSNITLGVGKITHSLNNDVKLVPSESRVINLIVQSNDDVASKYQVYYKSDDDLTDVLVGYANDSIDLPSGEIIAKGRKTIFIVLKNNSLNNISIELGVRGGLINKPIEDIILENNEYRVEKQINKELEQIKSPSQLHTFYKESFSSTATSNNILLGKTAFINGAKVTGTMTNNGGVNILLQQGESYTIPEGYYDGTGKIETDFLIGENILSIPWEKSNTITYMPNWKIYKKLYLTYHESVPGYSYCVRTYNYDGTWINHYTSWGSGAYPIEVVKNNDGTLTFKGTSKTGWLTIIPYN